MHEHLYKSVIEHSPVGYAYHRIICNENGHPTDYEFMDGNPSFEKMTGLKVADITGKRISDVLPGIRYEGFDWIAYYGQIALNGQNKEFEQFSQLLQRWYKVYTYSPEKYYFVTLITDITKEKQQMTERKYLVEALANEKKLLQITLTSVGDGVISCDNQGNVILINTVAQQLTGWTQEEAIGKSIEEVFNIINELTSERCENPISTVLDTGEIIELAKNAILISKDGTHRAIEDSASPIMDENRNIHGVVLVFRDVTDKKKKLDEINYLSYHDQLTGVYNRRFFEEELKRLDVQRNLPLTLIMLDVNGLKLANDAFGHSVGDKILVKVTDILKRVCRADEIIARIGGDEFVILLPKTNSKQAETFLNRIHAVIANEKVESLNVSFSSGWETKRKVGEDIMTILKKAEDFMYRNKISESSSVHHKTIEVIRKTLYEKNSREEQHSLRVSELCAAIGAAMDLSTENIRELRTVGLMHDIGKIAIDDRVLNKPGAYDKAEWVEISRHPEIGYQILRSVNEFAGLAEYILDHHERWDGLGYPRGLRGEEIPLEARIIAIADAYDAMISHRPYRPRKSQPEALAEIKINAGTQFDPAVVDAFLLIV